MTCRSAGYDGFYCLSWWSCRAVVGVSVRQGIVLSSGILQYMTRKMVRIWIATHAEDPVLSHTPGLRVRSPTAIVRDMTVGRIRASWEESTTHSLLLKGCRLALDVHRSKIAVFCVGNCPTGEMVKPRSFRA